MISTTELEYLLKGYEAEIETHKATIAKNVKVINAWNKAIIEYIAKGEDIITKYGVEVMDTKAKIECLEEETAKIKAEIHNRQFKASELMTAVMTEKVPAFESVTFDIQQFNEVVNAENAETIDTAVSKSEIPYIDEDAEEDLFEEYYALDAEVDELHKKFLEKRKALEETKRKLENVLKKKFKATEEKFYQMVEKAWDEDTTIDLYAQDGKSNWIAGNGWEKISIGIEFSNHPKYVIRHRVVPIAEYSTLEAVKGAVDKLAAAIERGDKEFTFPADK